MSFIISAPSSGSGKTTVTLGLLRALSRLGPVRGAKSGPDYIDPQFHAAASGAPCPNLDAWAMPRSLIRSLAAGRTPLIIEGAMGLFDGAPPDGKGATADLARMLGLPVVLVIDASAMAQSIAPLAAGFARHDSEVRIAGVILNKVGSDRHERMLRAALAQTGLTVLGALPRCGDIKRPSRHLGLVQAGDLPDLEPFLNAAADFVSRHLDLPAIAEMLHPVGGSTPAPPPQQHKRIAIARDAAFSFTYAHQLAGWAAAGTELLPFSPLADDPVPEADMIYLPGGYPELHARRLSGAGSFLKSLQEAARHTEIYGECGGYMVLGETLTDADGERHAMAGLLGLHSSFATRKLHLGYRRLQDIQTPSRQVKGHEFHYATTIAAEGKPLWHAADAEGHALPDMGLREGRVSGSFAHIISAV